MNQHQDDIWSADLHAIAELKKLNLKLSRLPRFKIRNRVTPIALQSLMRIGQIGSNRKLIKRGLRVENKKLSVDGHSVAVRLIRPRGKPAGIVVDFHGGGWVIGNAEMNDDLNAKMALTCNVAVISVNYRLAVWTPILSIMQDCLTAVRWVLTDSPDEFRELPVIVVGESAGGHLAAATLLSLKAWPELLSKVSGALLYYGVYDLSGTDAVRKAGRETLVLDGPGMIHGLRLLTPGLTDDQRRDSLLSPAYGDFLGMPPALLVACELDPLRDDTLELAKKWQLHAEIEIHVIPHAPHGIIHFPTPVALKITSYSHEWIKSRIAANAA